MVSVTPDFVRDRVRLSATDIEDAKVTDFIKDAEAAIDEETRVGVGYTDRSQGEAAAIYCLVHISSGVASGLSYRIGALSIYESARLRKPYQGRV